MILMAANFGHRRFAATAGQTSTEGWKRDAEAHLLEFFVQPEAILVQLANGVTDPNDMGFWGFISSYLAEGRQLWFDCNSEHCCT